MTPSMEMNAPTITFLMGCLLGSVLGRMIEALPDIALSGTLTP
jgi:hypothetical protein